MLLIQIPELKAGGLSSDDGACNIASIFHSVEEFGDYLEGVLVAVRAFHIGPSSLPDDKIIELKKKVEGLASSVLNAENPNYSGAVAKRSSREMLEHVLKLLPLSSIDEGDWKNLIVILAVKAFEDEKVGALANEILGFLGKREMILPKLFYEREVLSFSPEELAKFLGNILYFARYDIKEVHLELLLDLSDARALIPLARKTASYFSDPDDYLRGVEDRLRSREGREKFLLKALNLIENYDKIGDLISVREFFERLNESQTQNQT